MHEFYLTSWNMGSRRETAAAALIPITDITSLSAISPGAYPTGALMDLTKLVTDNSGHQYPVERSAGKAVTSV